MNLKILSLSFFITVFVGAVNAQYENMNFEHLTLNDGLSQITINSMMQDSYGFIWFATQDGLNRYDGVHNKIYRPDLENPEKTIAGSFINYIFEDVNKDIWIATYSGLSRYDRDEDRFYNFYHNPNDSNSISNNIVVFVQEDSYKNIWVFTPNGADKLIFEKNQRDSLKVVHYFAELAVKTNMRNLSGWTMDKNGDIWISSNTNGLFRLSKEEQAKKLPVPEQFVMQEGDDNSLPSNHLMAITTDANGEPWIYSYKMFINVKNEGGKISFITHKINEDIPASYVNGLGLYIDELGNVFFGLDHSGLFVYDTKNEKLYNYRNETYNPRSLINDNVNTVVKDNSGVLWVGTANGISKYNPDKNKFKRFEPQPNNPDWLRDPFVFSICVDKFKNYWVGTNNGRGLFIYHPDKNKFVNMGANLGDRTSLQGPLVYSVFTDSDKNMWVGTNNGLSKYDYHSNTFKTYRSIKGDTTSLVNNIVRCITEDKNGDLWIGTAFGVCSFNKKTEKFTRWNISQTNNINSNIQCLQFDKNGNLWIGMFLVGIIKMEFTSDSEYKVTKYQSDVNESNSLSSDQVSALLEDKNGNIWIATYGGGINKYDPKADKFTLYTTKDGLPGNNFYGLLEDNNFNLWFSSSAGLTMYDVKKKTFTNYDINDGLQSNEFNGGSYYKDDDGQLFFGGVNGFNVFNPDEITTNSIAPKIVFTDFKILNESIKPGKDSPLKESIQTTDVVELKPNQKDFKFEFAALHYVSPTQNTYAYKMEGYDEDWIDLGTQNYISFKSFPYGEYVLRVKAANCDGVWNEEGISVKVIIHPPFWATWWFRIIMLFFVLVIIWTYIKIRERNLKHEKRKLEKIVEKRTLEITEANEELKQQSEELKSQNEEITTQRDQLEIQHVAITDSILYAQRIQTAVLPGIDYIDEILPENFILFKPRNVVSGDFYWIRKVNEYIIIAVADCTGHGVPGAIMSMLGISFINEIVKNKEILQTNEALNELRRQIKQALRQTGKRGEADDGMDMGLVALNTKTNVLQYSGANCPLYLIQNGELVEVKPDKMPIGYYPNEKPTFTHHEIQLKPTDVFYLFSDGFADQLGGKRALKFKVSNFQKTIFENHKKPMPVQKEILVQELQEWMKGHDQTDDILVMGVRV